MTHHTLVYSWILIGDFSEGRIFHYEFTVCVSILKNELLLLVTFQAARFTRRHLFISVRELCMFASVLTVDKK